MELRTVADFACHCGENPLWHPMEKRIYWTDIDTGRLFRYDPAADHAEQCYADRPVGGFTLQPDGALLLFRDRGNVVLWRDGEVRQTIVEEIPDERGTRFNDVFADPEGRVYCGTMPAPQRLGRLYRLDRDGAYRVVEEGVGCANGMGLTLDGRRLYFTDSTVRTIWVYDYDRASGALSNRRPFVQTPENGGVPDGLTVDAAGDVWSARWEGSGLYRYSPEGELRDKIKLPTPLTTSLTFAGEGLDVIYATSAGGDKKAEHGEHAGALFQITGSGATGQARHFSRIDV